MIKDERVHLATVPGHLNPLDYGILLITSILPTEPPHSDSLSTSQPPFSPSSVTPPFFFLPTILPWRKWSWLPQDDGTISDSARLLSQCFWCQLLPANQSTAISISRCFPLQFLTYCDWVPCACFFHSFLHSESFFCLGKFSHWRMCQQILSTMHRLAWDSPFLFPVQSLTSAMWEQSCIHLIAGIG